MTSNTSSNPSSSRPMTLRQQLEAKVLFMRNYNQVGNEGWNEALDDLVRFCQEIAREATQGASATPSEPKQSDTSKPVTRDMVSEFFNASYGQPRFGHYPFEKYMVSMEFEVGGAYEDWGWIMYEKVYDKEKKVQTYKTFCSARNLKDLIAKADTKLNDMLATGSEPPRKPSDASKDELTQKPPQPLADMHSDTSPKADSNQVDNSEEA